MMKLRTITASSLGELAAKLNARNVAQGNIQLIAPEGHFYTALYWNNEYTAELTNNNDDNFLDRVTVEAPDRDTAWFAARSKFQKLTPQQGNRTNTAFGWTESANHETIIEYDVDLRGEAQ